MHISSSSAAGAEEVQGLLLARLQVEEEGTVLSQDEEEMAEIENREAMRQHGDVSAEEILAAQLPEQIRGNV